METSSIRVRHLDPHLTRTLACRVAIPPGDLARRHQALEAVRGWALAAVGGCPNTRDLLLDLVSGRLTEAEVARATGRNVSTVSRALASCLDRVRWVARLTSAAGPLLLTGTPFALDPTTGEPVASGWAVPLPHFGLRTPAPPTEEDVLRFLAARARAFRFWRGQPRCFAGRVEPRSGGVCLDVAVLLPGRTAALAFARRRGFPSAVHVPTGEEVSLTGRPSSVAA